MTVDFCLLHYGNATIVVVRFREYRIDIFYRVANPSIWMYYLPDPSTNRVLLVTTCVPGLLCADISIGSRQPHVCVYIYIYI